MKALLLAFLAVDAGAEAVRQGGGAPIGGSATYSSMTITGLQSGSVLFATTPATGLIGEDNANLFWDDATNSLGVGVSTPATTLDVNGRAQFGAGTTKSTFSTTGALTLATALAVGSGGTAGTGFASGAVIVSTRIGATDVFDDDSSELFWDFDSNELGVGTGEPAYKLHVASGNIYGQYGLVTTTGTFTGAVTATTVTVSGAGYTLSATNGNLQARYGVSAATANFTGIAQVQGAFQIGSGDGVAHAADNLTLQIDSNNDSTTNIFYIRNNAATAGGGTHLLSVREDGNMLLGSNDAAYSAQFHVRSRQADGASNYVLHVSSQDNAGFLTIDQLGSVGLRDTGPDAGFEMVSAATPTGYILAVSSQNDVTASVFGVTGGGHVVSSGTTPTIACNAGTGIMAADSNDMSGQFTGGSTSVDCTVTFVRTFSKKPRCWCNNETTTQAIRAVTTTTTIQCLSAAIGTDTITYGCQAAP